MAVYDSSDTLNLLNESRKVLEEVLIYKISDESLHSSLEEFAQLVLRIERYILEMEILKISMARDIDRLRKISIFGL